MTAPRTIQECWSTFKGLKEARKSRNDYATGVWLLWCSCQRDLFSSTLCSLRPLCVGVSVWGHHLYWPYFYWFNMLKKKRTNAHLHSLSCRGHTGVLRHRLSWPVQKYLPIILHRTIQLCSFGLVLFCHKEQYSLLQSRYWMDTDHWLSGATLVPNPL